MTEATNIAYFHRILVQTKEGAEEAQRRLVEHGHADATIFDETTPGWPHFAVHFIAKEPNLDLDYLRPDILPPKKNQKEAT